MMKMKRIRLPKMKRPLSKRERILLILLMIIIILLMVFRFIINPQYNRLESLREKKKGYMERISYMNKMLKREDEIYREWDDGYGKRNLILGKYFSKTSQSEIMYILNKLFDNQNLEILDIKFERPYEEQIGEYMVEVIEISIPYRGTYEDVLDIIKKISSNSKKILIAGLSLDKDDDGFILGDINLKIYDLGELGGMNGEITDMDIILNSDKTSPFETFDDYIKLHAQDMEDGLEHVEYRGNHSNSLMEGKSNNNNLNSLSNYNFNNRGNSDNDQHGKMNKEETYERKLLEDFENGDFYLNFSHDAIKGNISRSINSKTGKHSLRLEYSIPDLEDKSRIYLDLEERDIIIKSPPTTIGFWIYSYNYSPVILGFQFKEQNKDELEINLSKGVYWKGWRYLEITPPQNKAIYPIQLNKIYLELAHNTGDYGVLLLDKIEATYFKYGKGIDEYFDFYIVEKGDTLDKISIKLYGTTEKKDAIVKYNEIKSHGEIKEGRTLVIPR